jgi:hypothetical protein
MDDELLQIMSQPAGRRPNEFDLIPDFSASGPVVRFMGGAYSLLLTGMIVVPIIVCLAPLIPFALLFVIGSGIDKLIGRRKPPARLL